ncbi:MAG: DUF3090 family protein [Acidimicrobiales bacterium]
MGESFDFESVDRFTTGAIGEPGQRVFYLQVETGSTVLSFKCEKQQVAALAEYLAGVLADLPPAEPDPAPMTLVEPILSEWTAGAMSVAFDEPADRVVLVVEEVRVEDDEEGAATAEDVTNLRVRLTRAQVVAFVALAIELVVAGRPPCPLCGHPRRRSHLPPHQRPRPPELGRSSHGRPRPRTAAPPPHGRHHDHRTDAVELQRHLPGGAHPGRV